VIRILGVDPGSRITGYGVIAVEGNHHRYLASGCIRAGTGGLPERLGRIHAGLRELIETHRPHELAVEKVFVYRSADSALKLGHARGAVLLTAVMAGLPVAEYAAPKVKQAVTGSGRADKAQVAQSATPQADAADALALALCHAHSRTLLSGLDAVGFRRSRLR
jgi:crossover junction endodeoxyribonuclease RuvC